MEAGAVSIAVGAWWPWARGGDYGQTSSLPPAASVLDVPLGLGGAVLGVWASCLSVEDPTVTGEGGSLGSGANNLLAAP